MDHVKIEQIKKVLLKKELIDGMNKYLSIYSRLHTVNVATDSDFQIAYNGFYRMRQRNKDFYCVYYNLMETKKNDTTTFEEVFYYLKEKLNRCEASFSSKMVATLDPTKPVWDKYVLENIHPKLKPPYPSEKNREEKIVIIYNEICEWYSNFMQTEDANQMIYLFDELHPNVAITNIKKIDLILWQSRSVV